MSDEEETDMGAAEAQPKTQKKKKKQLKRKKEATEAVDAEAPELEGKKKTKKARLLEQATEEDIERATQKVQQARKAEKEERRAARKAEIQAERAEEKAKKAEEGVLSKERNERRKKAKQFRVKEEASAAANGKKDAKKAGDVKARGDPATKHLAKPTGAPTVEVARKFFKEQDFQVHVGPLEGFRSEVKLSVRRGSTDADGPRIGLSFPDGQFIDKGDCPTHHTAINQAVKLVREACRDTGVPGFSEADSLGGLRHLKLEVQRSSQRVQLTLVWHAVSKEEGGKPLNKLVKALAQNELFYAIWVNYNQLPPHAILAQDGAAWEQLAGEEGLLREELANCKVPYKTPGIFYPPHVFRSANLCEFGALVGALRSFVPAGSNILELYGGVGTIGLHLADLAKSLVCNDESPEAAACFQQGVKTLPKELRKKFRFEQGDAAERLELLTKCDLLLVDPPRKGLDEKVTGALASAAASGVRRILYVSCSFSSLKRDLGRLKAGGWKVSHAQGFLITPGFDNIDTLCILTRAE